MCGVHICVCVCLCVLVNMHVCMLERQSGGEESTSLVKMSSES